MTILGKKQMSEEDIKLNYITPVILNGWKGHMTMETKITDGRINISGNIVARSKPKFADYMLYLNDGKPIAVVEAKDNNHSVSHIFLLQEHEYDEGERNSYAGTFLNNFTSNDNPPAAPCRAKTHRCQTGRNPAVV